MRPFHILQHLMTDGLSLQCYREGRSLSIKELGNHLYDQLRHACYGVPEHYISDRKGNTLWLKDDDKEAEWLRDVFTKLVPQLADVYMDEVDGGVYLNEDRANEWQLMVQSLSPLFLLCSFIYYKHPVNFRNDAAVKDILLVNTQNTALPSIKDITLGQYGVDGVREMHFHLNASMEADRAVLNLMRHPRRILDNQAVIAEDTIGSCGYINRDEANTDVSRLCYLEYLLAESVLGGKDVDEKSLSTCLCSAEFVFDRYDEIKKLYVKYGVDISDLQFEALLIHRTLYALQRGNGKPLRTLEKTFHAYLLLFGRLRTLAVLQQGESGLMAFNRYFGLGLRSDDEKVSARNLWQLVGNTIHPVKYIDMRLGVLNGRESLKLMYSEAEIKSYMHPDDPKIVHVALIAKKRDKGISVIRNEELRKHLRDRVIPSLCSAKGMAFYSAVDVAGRDYEVSADVFAGLFDELRNGGYRQFTYHAGEDFYHLLGGLRAIFESVHFLKLGAGCRIGHASAAGIAPHLWSDVLGGEVRMKRGEYLDDLIFTRYFILVYRVPIPKKNLHLIEVRIKELARAVYGRHCTIDNLTAAWHKRSDDPRDYVYKPNLTDVELLVADYHDINVRKRYNEEITVSCYEVLYETHMVRLQKALLRLLAEREIAIEAMPTSNVYIGLHQSFHSYHLKQWIDWKFCKRYKMRMPAIVIGSDEPGILCTNIMTEYAHVCNMLDSANDMLLSKRKIPEVLRTLASDSRKFEFTEK